MLTKSSRALPLMVALAGCKTVFLQSDGFAARIPKECQTEEACRSLLREADARVEKCQDNTIGYVPCADARADRSDVASRLKAFRDQRGDAESREQEAKAEAARDRRDSARRAQAAEQEERRRADVEREDERTRKREAAELSSRRVAAWREQALTACARDWSDAACATAPADLPDGTASECMALCAQHIQSSVEGTFRDALAQCVATFVRADAKGTPTCGVVVPSTSKVTYADRSRECDARCKSDGEARVAKAKADAAAEAVHLRKHVKCCDGSRSPTCTYATERPGCCSRHGGVCGE